MQKLRGILKEFPYDSVYFKALELQALEKRGMKDFHTIPSILKRSPG